MRAGEAGDSTRRNKSFDGANGREPERRYTADTEGERRSVQRVRRRKEGSLTHTITHTFMNRQLDYRFRPLHRRLRRHLG